ncbi:MAG: hemolysin family protein [Acidobacteriota bacterium]|nr:hemolysin family protein [Acidobacteriota bacterium]MDH3784018.1 hemolysin family protein [Acidobacteriota bacterium]
MATLLLFVSFALSISFLCSLLEAGLLAARDATLTEQRDAGEVGSGYLLDIRRGQLEDAISAILILNTISHTLGATMAGAQAARVFGDPWVGAFSGVLTLLILVLSEIIPKTIGATYAAPLAGFTGRTLRILIRIMWPLLRVSRALTGWLTRGKRHVYSRSELKAVIDNAAAEGTVTDDESKMLANLLRMREVRVADVMTPRTVVYMHSAEATIAELLAQTESQVFSRIPLFRGDRENVVGYLLLRDVLWAVADGTDTQRGLDDFVRKITFIPELARVDVALAQILRRREPIGMVTDEHGGIEGLVTLEDLTETVLGVEIVDESDRVVDMRAAALKLRDQRLERLRRRVGAR